jgi:hypothetical protein
MNLQKIRLKTGKNVKPTSLVMKIDYGRVWQLWPHLKTSGLETLAFNLTTILIFYLLHEVLVNMWKYVLRVISGFLPFE